MDLKNISFKKIRQGLEGKEFSSVEITKAYLHEIKTRDKKIGAYLSVMEETALKKSKDIDNAIAKGIAPGSLTGVPVALKDNMNVSGCVTTAASKILKDFVSPYDATVVRKLDEAGAVILGKTNMDEFAMGSSTENSAFKTTKNPHDLARVPGGSSGGSAAAVAADMAVAALGSDTGGSIREPASFCGVVGLKPTYGMVSRYGLLAMASSLDQIGPLTKSVEDARYLFDVIRGFDPMDATSKKEQVESYEKPETIKKLKIGLPKEYFIDGLDPYISGEINKAIEKLKLLGFTFKEISLPHTKYALACYYIIMPAEVSANLARFDGIRFERDKKAKTLGEIYARTRGNGFGEEVKRRILLGTFVLSSGYYDAYYAKAQKVRQLIKRDFEEALDPANGSGVDVILTPVTPTPAFKIGSKTDNPLEMYLSDIFTITANLAGVPALSIPVRDYRDSGDLPVGFQLIGRHFEEKNILGIGELYEK